MDINKYGAKGKLGAAHLFSLAELDEGQIYEILHLARKLKQKQQVKEKLGVFDGKNVAIMLKSSSSRIRISFELAVNRLGGKTLYLSPNDTDFLNGLTYLDAANMLYRYGVNGLVVKNLTAEEVAQFKTFGKLPVIALKDGRGSPCQILASLYTVWDTARRLSGVKLLVAGDCRRVNAEELNAYAKCGVEVTLCCPEECSPDEQLFEKLSQFGDVKIERDLKAAIKNADIVTSVRGEEAPAVLAPYKITAEMLNASPAAKYLHVLPVKHGEEVEDEVLYGDKSVAFERAGNLIFAEQSLMMLLFR